MLTKNIEGTFDILGPLVDDVKVRISLNETAGGGTHSRTHVGDKKATIGLGPDLIRNRCEDTAVALEELRAVRVRGVEIEPSVLRELEIFPKF